MSEDRNTEGCCRAMTWAVSIIVLATVGTIVLVTGGGLPPNDGHTPVDASKPQFIGAMVCFAAAGVVLVAWIVTEFFVYLYEDLRCCTPTLYGGWGCCERSAPPHWRRQGSCDCCGAWRAARWRKQQAVAVKEVSREALARAAAVPPPPAPPSGCESVIESIDI